jgi:D-sedoheptulose 7-phosphate isomerase
MNLKAKYGSQVQDYLEESSKLQSMVAGECLDAILETAELIISAFESGSKLLLCGNGGSAADCQHVATELVSALTKEFERPGLPAIALTTDTSMLTAYSNDTGFEGVFERQVSALGKPGDVLLGISTSGNSVNVIRAVEAANKTGIRTVGLTGAGGNLGDLCTVAIAVPSNDTQHIQESHLAIEHVICHLIEQSMFAGEKGMITTNHDHH